MKNPTLKPPAEDEISTAQKRLKDLQPTPLVPCRIPGAPNGLYLKLETVQPTGSFKVRGAANAVRKAVQDGADRVWTASAGNMGLGVAWAAKKAGIQAAVIVPADAPPEKTGAIRDLGGKLIPLSREEYWTVQKTHHRPGMRGVFIHPFADPSVMAGNGTMALEILDQLPEVETITAPYGGGGLSCGLAAALKIFKSEVRVWAAETENGAPLTPSLEAGEMVRVRYWKSFVSGMGSPAVFDRMWPLVQELLAGAVGVSLEEIARAMLLLLEYHDVLAEPAGAVSLAAGLSGRVPGKQQVCVISGGNIDPLQARRVIEQYGKQPSRPDGTGSSAS